jgi:GDP-L-fucose synthase
MMNKEAEINIAGHNDMVGSVICRALTAKGYANLIGASSKVLNLKH